VDSELVEKRGCPLCPSSDAFAVYDDGHGFCFSCRGHVAEVDPFQEGQQQQTQQPSRNTNVSEFVTGSYIDLADRRLFARTLKKFKYTVSEGKHYAPYFDRQGNFVAKKYEALTSSSMSLVIYRKPGYSVNSFGHLDNA